ncbi:MAG: type II toxin-antitoxin system HicA family toxin [Minisyncoccia bacterium]
MHKLKQLSGKDVIKIFELHGFKTKRTTGSHARLTFVRDDSSYHVTIPLHDSLKKGTLHGVMKDFEECFGKEEANNCFLG